MILCVAGNPSIDKLFEVQRLAPGGIHRPLNFVQRPGGKGINVARAAASLGADVSVAGLLGGHSGRWIEHALKAEPVKGEFGWVTAETRASLSVADRETGRLTEFYEDSAPITAAEWGELGSIVESLLDTASWITLSGSLPVGAPADGYAALVAAARRAGVPAAVDARGEALAQALTARPEVVKVNASEAGELLGSTVADPDMALGAARDIRGRLGGAGHAVVITLGELGAVLVDGAGAAYRGKLDVRGAYPVGSGDAFLAGLVVGLESGEPLTAAAGIALGAGAANAELPGAAVLDRERARQLARSAILERVSDES